VNSKWRMVYSLVAIECPFYFSDETILILNVDNETFHLLTGVGYISRLPYTVAIFAATNFNTIKHYRPVF